MKKLKEKSALLMKILLLTATVWYCIARTETVRAAAAEAVNRCIYVLIPSLYAMMTVTALLTSSGVLRCLPEKFRFFGMDSTETAAFMLGMFAGYPVGTVMLCSGSRDKRRAALLSGACFGAGPAFVFGCISGELYSSPVPGRVILLSNIAANLLIGTVLSLWLGRSTSDNGSNQPLCLTADLLTESVAAGGCSVAGMCFAVIAFSAALAALDDTGLTALTGRSLSMLTDIDPKDGAVLVRSVLDVTAVSGLTGGDYRLLPWISALTAFGGVCVMFQIAAVTKGHISLRPLAVTRVVAAAVSFTVCRLIMPFMLKNEAVSAETAEIHGFRAPSPVPSVLLMIMTLMLLAGNERKNNA